ncbi:unnamed protein product [Ixodes pacificus]
MVSGDRGGGGGRRRLGHLDIRRTPGHWRVSGAPVVAVGGRRGHVRYGSLHSGRGPVVALFAGRCLRRGYGRRALDLGPVVVFGGGRTGAYVGQGRRGRLRAR